MKAIASVEDKLILLEVAMREREAKDAELKATALARDIDALDTVIRDFREEIQEAMITKETKTISIKGIRATMVEKHDYIIADPEAFFRATEETWGDRDHFMKLDQTAIKPMASAFRKNNERDFPGIESVPKTWIQVTLL